jgi:hypothetical protein
MDFSQFTALKVLEVHDDIFHPHRFVKEKRTVPYDFYERLFESLEYLQVSPNAVQYSA